MTDVEARTIGARAYRPALAPGARTDKTPLFGIPTIARFPFAGSAIVYWDGGPQTPPAPRAATSPTAAARPALVPAQHGGGAQAEVRLPVAGRAWTSAAACRARRSTSAAERAVRLSDELQAWIERDEPSTLGSLVDVFGNRAFAIVFVMLLGVPALPLPTGGATHLFELIAVVLALQLILGREQIALPARWRRVELATGGRFVRGLLRVIRRLERMSRPRARFLFGHRLTNVVFGLLVMAGSIVAFLAPPFTGLDTLPALGVVLVALGVLLEDLLVVVVGVVVGVAGAVLIVVAGTAALHGIDSLL